jgi:hypothetical protein
VPPLPPPLPPEERPVGQLVAEAIRLYGRRFWRSLAVGVPPAVFLLGLLALDDAPRAVFALVAGPILLSLSLTLAATLVTAEPRGSLPVAILVGIPAFVPFALSRVTAFLGTVLLAFVWFALVGLAVPAVVVEGRGPFDAVRRAVALARADFVHALGAIATLGILIVLSLFVLFFLLAGFGDQTLPAAAVLAVLVLGPLFFLGAALLYFDQAARQDQKHVPRAK